MRERRAEKLMESRQMERCINLGSLVACAEGVLTMRVAEMAHERVCG